MVKRVQPQRRLAIAQFLVEGELVREGACVVGPEHLKESRARSGLVEAQGGSEERAAPGRIGVLEQDRVISEDAFDACAGGRGSAGQEPASRQVQAASHDVDAQAEHGQIRQSVRVPEPDGEGPSLAGRVGGDHDDAPAVLADVRDQRLVEGRPP